MLQNKPPQTLWYKTTVLFCSHVLELRNSEGAQWKWLDSTMSRASAGVTWHLGAGIPEGMFTPTSGDWHWLSAGTPTHGLSMWCLHGLLWASSQYGGWVPRGSTPEGNAEAHGTFMVLPQKLYSVTDCCHALLAETRTKVCRRSRRGIRDGPSPVYGEDSQGHVVKWACGTRESFAAIF